MAGPQLSSKTVTWFDQTETVTITRDVANVGGTSSTIDTIYTGAADCQTGNGSTFINPQGVVDQADGLCIVQPLSNGTLPAVKVGDKLTCNGVDYNVIQVSPWTFEPIHLELQLKRGPLGYKPAK